MNFNYLSERATKNTQQSDEARLVMRSANILLNANEYHITPPWIINIISNNVDNFNSYPTPQEPEVIRRYAEYIGCELDNIFISRGADEAVEIAPLAFLNPGKKVMFFSPTYPCYLENALDYGQDYVDVPLTSEFQLNLPEIKKNLDNNDIGLIFICNPNNPTGNLIKKEDILQVIQWANKKCVVVVDEAYMEFAGKDVSSVSLIKEYDNLVVFRTLSKAFGLAGLRVGFAIGQNHLVSALRSVQNVYPFSYIVNQIAKEALAKEQIEYMHKTVECIKKRKQNFINQLQEFDFIEHIYETFTNFICIKVKNGNKIFEHLYNDGILILNVHSRIPNHLRISIGSEEQMSLVINSLRNLK